MAVSKVILNGTTLIDVTQKTVEANKLLNGYTALKNDGTDITGSIASKTSSDLTASGATVTAPAGYYASSASKAVASGSASTPATTITANPSISVSSGGLITASVSGSQSVTPTVSAGYVSSGTAGTITVSGSNTRQLTTQAAQTITPTTTNQTIASGKYLTGAQTILGDENLLAENIKKDVSIFNVTGTLEGNSALQIITRTGVGTVQSDGSIVFGNVTEMPKAMRINNTSSGTMTWSSFPTNKLFCLGLFLAKTPDSVQSGTERWHYVGAYKSSSTAIGYFDGNNSYYSPSRVSVVFDSVNETLTVKPSSYGFADSIQYNLTYSV